MKKHKFLKLYNKEFLIDYYWQSIKSYALLSFFGLSMPDSEEYTILYNYLSSYDCLTQSRKCICGSDKAVSNIYKLFLTPNKIKRKVLKYNYYFQSPLVQKYLLLYTARLVALYLLAEFTNNVIIKDLSAICLDTKRFISLNEFHVHIGMSFDSIRLKRGLSKSIKASTIVYEQFMQVCNKTNSVFLKGRDNSCQ